jgi:hypothetical protein
MGPPVKIIATPKEYVPEQSAVAHLYDVPAYGRVVVIQHLPDVPESEWETIHIGSTDQSAPDGAHLNFRDAKACCDVVERR